MSITVRDPKAADEADFLRLWGDYLDFYDKALDPAVTAVTAETWRRILDPASAIFARIVERDGRFAGFAVCLLHEGTWVTQPICYLEDLFVDQALRGGLGKALIDDLLVLGRERGWARLYWQTDADNVRARRLYDQYREDDGVVRYTLRLDEEPPRR
jgi:ribosomal protein S18 acetylase RimI-like enzyme